MKNLEGPLALYPIIMLQRLAKETLIILRKVKSQLKDQLVVEGRLLEEHLKKSQTNHDQ
jgi:hypothetical protein